MAAPWFVQHRDGTIDGPLHERQVSEHLLAGKIPTDSRVRQGESGPWCDSVRARDAFQQLADNGWYIRASNKMFGPFTADRLLELHRTGELKDDADVRQGTTSGWRPASAVLASWQAQRHEAGQGGHPLEGGKWSTEPIRHYRLPLDIFYEPVVEDCLPTEHLRLDEPSDETNERIAVLRDNEQLLGFISQTDSQQLRSNSQRGISHVVLLAQQSPAEIDVVLCPPGTTSEQCQRYIDAHFRCDTTDKLRRSKHNTAGDDVSRTWRLT